MANKKLDPEKLTSPYDLLTPEELKQLRADLAAMAKQRRRAMAEMRNFYLG